MAEYDDTVDGYDHIVDDPLGAAVDISEEEEIPFLVPVSQIAVQRQDTDSIEEIAEDGEYSPEQVREALEYADENPHEVGREIHERRKLLESAKEDSDDILGRFSED